MNSVIVGSLAQPHICSGVCQWQWSWYGDDELVIMESMTIVVMCCQWVSCTIEHLYKQTAAQLCNLACVRLYCIGCTSATCCCCCGGRLLLLLSLFWPLSSFSCALLFLLVPPPSPHTSLSLLSGSSASSGPPNWPLYIKLNQSQLTRNFSPSWTYSALLCFYIL